MLYFTNWVAMVTSEPEAVSLLGEWFLLSSAHKSLIMLSRFLCFLVPDIFQISTRFEQVLEVTVILQYSKLFLHIIRENCVFNIENISNHLFNNLGLIASIIREVSGKLIFKSS